MKKITMLAAAAVLTMGIAAAQAQGAGGSAGGESGAANAEKKAPNKEQTGTTSGTTMSAPMAAPSGSSAMPAQKDGKTGDAVTTTTAPKPKSN